MLPRLGEQFLLPSDHITYIRGDLPLDHLNIFNILLCESILAYFASFAILLVITLRLKCILLVFKV